jgi:ubiquinol oxidase
MKDSPARSGPTAPGAYGADTSDLHHATQDFSDRFALVATRLMRWVADSFFAKRCGYRAVVLEAVAVVPGMVGATATQLQCLRRMVDDDGWIRHRQGNQA